MPWKRAKALPPPDNTLFEACFRIQREACEAAGRHIPLIVENVRGAQKWVGRARWNFGSYYLWGDVPALMPMTVRSPKFILDDIKNGQRRNVDGCFDDGLVISGRKSTGMNWSDQTKRGQDFTRIAGNQAIKSSGGSWFGDYSAMKEGIKKRGSGREWFAGDSKISRMTSSKSSARKFASAMIAKIPGPLARHIAVTFR